MLGTLQTVAEIVAGLATAGALIAAVVELRGQRAQQRSERIAEIAAVSFTLDVIERPQPGASDEAIVRYVYQFTAHNPGRYPISNVEVGLIFPNVVERVHYNLQSDAATTTMVLTSPSIAPRSNHAWKRNLLVQSRHIDEMKRMTASMTFDTPDAGRCVVRMPSVQRPGAETLRRHLPRWLKEA